MEQKQLDEIDETFFGEEFVDDEPTITIKSVKEESPGVNSKKSTAASKKKTVALVKVTSTKKSKAAKSAVKQPIKEKTPTIEVVPEPTTFRDDFKVEPAKGPVDISSPVNPWSEEKEANNGFFQEASTWKAVTGLVIILLLVSVFTQGFHFSTGSPTSEDLSIEEAEAKALEYVNTKLLRPPFVAELESSAVADNVYLIRLSVADQSVDSYISKNGQLFFPQGFNTSKSLEEQMPTSRDIPEQQLDADEPPVEESPLSVVEEPVLPVETENSSVEDVEELPETPPAQEAGIMMTSRKWMFFPQKVEVQASQPVKLIIAPDNSNPSFALPSFTFSIPQLGVEKEVRGRTIVEFTPNAPGKYPFSCSSCEDWRGMSGVLVVE